VNNDQALADALTRLLEDSALRQTMGCAAQTFARENFTIEQTCQRHADLYLRLLEQKR
jgi:glycosyltransferase involved in cell wall biosynthesis